jgi:hypothetical protein
MPNETHQTIVPEVRARQGLRGRHILIVLLVSTVLAAIGLLTAWGWKAPDMARSGSEQKAQAKAAAQTFHAPEPAPIIPQPGDDHTAPEPR